MLVGACATYSEWKVGLDGVKSKNSAPSHLFRFWAAVMHAHRASRIVACALVSHRSSRHFRPSPLVAISHFSPFIFFLPTQLRLSSHVDAFSLSNRSAHLSSTHGSITKEIINYGNHPRLATEHVDCFYIARSFVFSAPPPPPSAPRPPT